MILKNLLLNCQDFFIFLDQRFDDDVQTLSEQSWQALKTNLSPNKQLQKIQIIAQLILKKDLDTVSLVEVGGKESLENFTKFFLNGQYQVFHHPSNSDRGIDIGFLVKRSLAPQCELKHINHKRLANGKRFRRGVLKLKIKLEDQTIYFLLCHLKSKLDLKQEDFEGRGQRSAEVGGLLEEVRRLQALDPHSHIAILGDLNGVIYKEHTDEELRDFESADMIDLQEHNNTPLEDRFTYVFFKNRPVPFPMQLDYVLGNENFRGLVKQAYISDFHLEVPPFLPRSMQEKNKLASDHYPYYFELEI